MSQTAKVQEPPMEEILASIRRIISDDDGSGSATAPSPQPGPPPPQPPAAARPPGPLPPQPSDGNSEDVIDAEFAEPAAVAPPPAADTLDLTDEMTAPPEAQEPAPSFRANDSASDFVFTERPSEPPPPPRAAEAPRTLQPAFDSGLLSNTTAAAVDSAFNALAHTVLGQNARTLEDLVKEMLRPMLKSWLDDNLPGLVERIVRAEIERVSRGRG